MTSRAIAANRGSVRGDRRDRQVLAVPGDCDEGELTPDVEANTDDAGQRPLLGESRKPTLSTEEAQFPAVYRDFAARRS